MPITKEQFYTDPAAAIQTGEVPDEMIGRAWREHETFRDDVVYELARSVSKTGTFDPASAIWLRVLPKVLNAEEAAVLYVDLLEQGQRMEADWRPAFVEAFPAAAALLPESADAAVLWATLEQQIVTGYGDGFEEALTALVSLPGGRAMLESAGDDGETLLDAARRLKRDPMIVLLRETLSGKG